MQNLEKRARELKSGKLSESTHDPERKGDGGLPITEDNVVRPSSKAVQESKQYIIQFVAGLFGQPAILPRITGRRVFERLHDEVLREGGRELAKLKGVEGKKAVTVHNVFRSMKYNDLTDEQKRMYEEKADLEKTELELELRRESSPEEILK